MSFVTKVTGAILFSAGLMVTSSTAQAGYVSNDPINATDPFGLFANCSEFTEAGGGACSNITTKTTTEDGTTESQVVGLRIEGLPTENLLDQHFTSNDALPIHIPMDTINWDDLTIGQLNLGGNDLASGAQTSINQRNGISANNLAIGWNRRAQTLGTFRADIDGTLSRGPSFVMPSLKTDTLLTMQGNLSFQGTLSNGYDMYDYDIQQGRGFRNILTRIGNPGPGTPFTIKLDGSVRINIP